MLRVSACSGLVMALLVAAVAHAAPQIPATAFAALPQVSDVELSPDAQLVAWCDHSGPEAKVVIFDLAAKAFRRTLAIDPKMVLGSLLWSDDETLLVSLSDVRRFTGGPLFAYSRTLAVDVTGGDSRMLLMEGRARPLVSRANLMQDDVTDGVQAMIRQGIADPHRICIVGVGYGGYAALAGAAFTPGLYACAVSVNGIADLSGFLSYQEERDARGKEADSAVEWVRDIGTPLDANVVAHSPVNAAAAVKIPVLLLHATDDAAVPFSQSEAMANALNDQGKRVTLIKLPGDDDSLSQSDTRLTVLQDTEWFLHEYLN